MCDPQYVHVWIYAHLKDKTMLKNSYFIWSLYPRNIADGYQKQPLW